MASPDPGRTPAQGDEAGSTSPWPLRKLQSFTPGLWSQYKVYENAVVESTKDALVLVKEHQAEAIGCATVAGFILFRESKSLTSFGQNFNEIAKQTYHLKPITIMSIDKGPRRFLYRNTFGRFKTEKDLLNDAEESMMEYKTSIANLKKESKYTLDKVAIGESDLQRGQTDLRSTGKQIQSLIGSIYKAESTAAGLMDRLRTIPTRQSLELRAEVASMASDLKNQRYALQERINKISEYGVRV
nr:RGS1-HXK1-interacting protein 1 isoform X2 [Setaria viridis]